jgi:eukaryotic-like serine/threonine-protein kinase
MTEGTVTQPTKVGPGSFRPGQIIEGKFRVERQLGVGGMGFVVLATHLHLDELVAIKFLLPDLAGVTEASQRFLREARAVVKIRNDHVAQVKDVGILESGSPYMVMEYLRGSDLGHLIAERGQGLPLQEAVDYVLDACDGIGAAHAKGIIHRDLKPANLFLTERDDGPSIVKVLDFGISKMAIAGTPAAEKALTKTSSMMGSPLYMSPEQMQTPKLVDARTDIWALGCILYELLTARTPFDGESIPHICSVVMHADPLPITSVRADVPPEVQAVVTGCLQKDPNHRIPTVVDLTARLLPFGTPGRIVPPRVSRSPSGPAGGSTQPSVGMQPRTSSSAPPEVGPLPPLPRFSGPPVGEVATTVGAWAEERRGTTLMPQRRTLVAALALAALAIGGIVWGVRWRMGAGGAPANAAASAPSPSAPPAAPPDLAAPVISSAPAAEIAPIPSTSASAALPRPVAGPTRSPSRAAAAGAPRPAASQTKPSEPANPLKLDIR